MKNIKKILLCIALIFVFALPVVLTGCNQELNINELQQAAYRAAKNYFDYHQSYDNFQNITYTVNQKSNQKIKTEELEYWAKAGDETSATSGYFWNEYYSNQTYTIAIKKGTESLIAKITVKVTTTDKEYYVVDDDEAQDNHTLKRTNTTDTTVETYTLAPVSDGETTKYVLTYTNGNTKKWTTLGSGDNGTAAGLGEKVENVLAIMNENILGGFFMGGELYALGFYGNLFSINKDGNTITISNDTHYPVIDGNTGTYVVDKAHIGGTLTFVDEKVSKMESVYSYEGQDRKLREEQTVTVSNSASVATSLTGFGDAKDSTLLSEFNNMLGYLPEFMGIMMY